MKATRALSELEKSKAMAEALIPEKSSATSAELAELEKSVMLKKALKVLPAACRYRLNAAPPKIFSFTKIMDNSTKNASIELAINDLNRQLILNFRGTAKKYSFVKSTLRQKFKN